MVGREREVVGERGGWKGARGCGRERWLEGSERLWEREVVGREREVVGERDGEREVVGRERDVVGERDGEREPKVVRKSD